MTGDVPLGMVWNDHLGWVGEQAMTRADTTQWVALSERELVMRAEIERLRALLQKLRWKSIDKDNMEFRCDTTCYVMDEIHRALEPKP